MKFPFFKTILGWLAVAGVSVLLYWFFGLLFVLFFVAGVVFFVWDGYQNK